MVLAKFRVGIDATWLTTPSTLSNPMATRKKPRPSIQEEERTSYIF
jgi:hypothetical protein